MRAFITCIPKKNWQGIFFAWVCFPLIMTLAACRRRAPTAVQLWARCGGSSDALSLDAESVSAWPVYVTGRNQSIVEVWRDERLVYTQQLQTGIQALDTRRLPFGIYRC
ncbi:Uncharacterised protein [Cedecea neteri]|uniref:Pilus assembly protein E-set like domain-containing protein n=1 Tax=Cedecea neteri TaxID=158822 RepID=A0A2X3IFJ9_9ENTR|nr:Uncharacterised protein [Cedecea neteri]